MATKKKRILVVDDEPDTRELMQTILEHEGYDVIITQDGERAIEAISQKPNLILLDIRMPGELNGIDVCKRIKNDSKYKSIPIIFFSAKVLEHHIEEGFQAGGDAYITKPFNSTELLKIIRKFVT